MKRIFLAGLSMIVFFCWLQGAVHAAAPAAAPKDVVLVLDNSGSMRKNDPQFLTKKVVADFLTRLEGDTRVSLIIFDEKVNEALPLTAPGAADAQKTIVSTIDRIDYRGKLTDTPAAVERAVYELRMNGRQDASKMIVLMTDGIVETGNKDRDVERTRWLREELASEAKNLGIRIFGIAFTEEADFELIQALGQKTGGAYFRALKADQIPGIFKEVDAAIRAPVVPPREKEEPRSGRGMIWIVAVVGIIALGIVAIVVAAGRKRTVLSNGVEIAGGRIKVKLPKASLKDIREITGKDELPLVNAVTKIGRAPGNQVVIDKPTVTGHHATIEFRNGAFHLIDERSTNGTRVNGKKISEAVKLKHGDRIAVDAYEFVFAIEELAGQEKTQLAGGPRTILRQPDEGPGAGRESDDSPAEAEKAKGAAPADEEEATRLKDMCPNHPAWKASGVCSICRVAYCDKCLVEKNGRQVCVNCNK